jgi:dienelactone hydrolase
MKPGESMTMDGYTSFDFSDGAVTRPVFVRGQGPAVIVMHEVPGIHPLVLRFAERVAAAGHRVYLPSLLGDPGRAVSPGYGAVQIFKAICIRREFAAWATDQSSPIVEWLRALARKAHAECGGPGVGAIGMCLTGNFAMAMMTEPSVVAPVLSQPSLPVAVGAKRRANIGMSPDEIAIVRQRLESEDLSAIGLRFHGDAMVPPERFATYKRCFGDRFEAIEIDPAEAQPSPGAKPHAVLTINLRDDDPQGATKRAETRVIEFFRQRLHSA